MKKNPKLLTLLFCITMSGQFHGYSQITHTLSFSSDDLQCNIIQGGDNIVYTKVSLNGCDNGLKESMPSLPYKYLHFIVPSICNTFSININSCTSSTYELDNLIYPFQKEHPNNTPTNEISFCSLDTAIYHREIYPQNPVEAITDGYFDGDKHILTVRISPVQYQPEGNKIILNTTIDFTINCHNDITKNNAIQPCTPLKPQESNRFTFIENNANINSFTSSIAETSTRQLINLPFYEYVIITTDSLVPSFQRLANWKRLKGYNAGIISIQQILSSSDITGDEISNLNDDAGKLRQYLRFSFQNGTKYVLLGGNNRIMPIRYGRGYNNGTMYNPSAPYDDARIPSDLYFSDLNGNWNKDGDAFYGELSEDAVDYFPELYVGRLLCSTPQEVQNYIDKLILYEYNPGKGDTHYLKRSFFTQSDQLQRDNEAYSFASRLIEILPDTLIMEESHGWDNALSNPDEYFPKGKDVIDAMNNHMSGFMSWSGHGCPVGIGTSNRNVNQPNPCFNIIATEGDRTNTQITIENGNGLDNMLNYNYPGVAYTTACETAPFDIIGPNIKYNMAESFTVGGPYGGIAYLASTRYGWVTSSGKLALSFLDLIKTNKYSIGESEALSKSTNTHQKHWLGLSHNLIGCPETKMWTSIPTYFANISVSQSDRNTIVETAVDSCTICLTGLFSSETTVQKQHGSSASFSNPPKNYIISVWKHNYFPYFAPTYIQNEEITNRHYIQANTVYAGKLVDQTKQVGPVILKQGANVLFDTTGTTRLEAGFTVEAGATLTINTGYLQ